MEVLNGFIHLNWSGFGLFFFLIFSTWFWILFLSLGSSSFSWCTLLLLWFLLLFRFFLLLFHRLWWFGSWIAATALCIFCVCQIQRNILILRFTQRKYCYGFRLRELLCEVKVRVFICHSIQNIVQRVKSFTFIGVTFAMFILKKKCLKNLHSKKRISVKLKERHTDFFSREEIGDLSANAQFMKMKSVANEAIWKWDESGLCSWSGWMKTMEF